VQQGFPSPAHLSSPSTPSTPGKQVTLCKKALANAQQTGSTAMPALEGVEAEEVWKVGM
jgi:hypothetical protein